MRKFAVSLTFSGMDTVQVNIRLPREMLAAIMAVSGGNSRKRVPVYIRQAIALMLKIDKARVDPAWVELVQGKRNDMATPEGRARAEKQLAEARASRARKRQEKPAGA